MACGSEYRKVLEQLEKTGTISQKYNSMLKLLYSTEDSTLIGLLRKYCDIKRSCIGHKMISDSVAKETRDSIASIKEYCNMRIEENKPQWQIIAEQHGWRPPRRDTGKVEA